MLSDGETLPDAVDVGETEAVCVAEAAAEGEALSDGETLPDAADVGEIEAVRVAEAAAEGEALSEALRHSPAGSVHSQYAVVSDVVTAAADDTAASYKTPPISLRTRSFQLPIADRSEASDGAYGGEPFPCLVRFIASRVRGAAELAKVTRSKGSASQAHCAQQPPLTPAACQDVPASPSMAYADHCAV
jgi:hypothetical protein